MYNFFIKKTHFREKILGKMKEICTVKMLRFLPMIRGLFECLERRFLEIGKKIN